MIKRIVGRNYVETKINNENKLIALFNEESKENKKKKTWQILEELGVEPRQIIDDRTEMILEEYLFYQKAPHQAPYNSMIWKKSVIMLNSILKSEIF